MCRKIIKIARRVFCSDSVIESKISKEEKLKKSFLGKNNKNYFFSSKKTLSDNKVKKGFVNSNRKK